MKKKFRYSLMIMLLVLGVVLLAACGEGEKTTNTPEGSPEVEQGEQQEQTENNSNGQTGAGTTTEADKDLFVAVVGEASNLDSFSITMTADQKMDMGGNAMENSTNSTMDITVKPELAFKQLTKIETNGMTQEVESYLTPNGFYMKDPTSQAWVKLPEAMMDQALQITDQDALDPSAQLSQLIDYAEQFAVVEKDGIYTFTLTAEGEAFSELIQQQLEEQQAAFEQASDIVINSIEYVIDVEKDSNKLLAMKVLSDMSIDDAQLGGTMSIVSDIKMEYSNHNGIEAIVVPEEALNAEELSLE